MMETPEQNRNVFAVKKFLSEYLDLRKDKDNELETVDSIRKGVEFKGANLWILIFAIFMASLGLNVNSTAVIIGAMLISPLMGPIMGVGLSVGLNDFELMKRSLKSFLITTLFSVTTATVFFLVSPVAEGQSELLARTSPTIYDVFIALMGGLAGVVALSTKEKGNVIPGVAIATALMPPLCTAGYGLATGNLVYFLGAFYLYFINSVFISLATFAGVRVMHFQRKEFVDKKREKKVRQYIILIAVLTMCPAVYLTVGIIQSTFYESAANRFVAEQLSFENTQVLDKKIHYHGSKDNEIRVVLIGHTVPPVLKLSPCLSQVFHQLFIQHLITTCYYFSQLIQTIPAFKKNLNFKFLFFCNCSYQFFHNHISLHFNISFSRQTDPDNLFPLFLYLAKGTPIYVFLVAIYAKHYVPDGQSRIVHAKGYSLPKSSFYSAKHNACIGKHHNVCIAVHDSNCITGNS